jgi:fucose permease
VAGGGLAALAAALGGGVAIHFTLVAVGTVVLGLLASRTLLPPAELHSATSEHGEHSTWLSGWSGRLLLLGGLAFVFTFAEGTALDWSAVLLRDSHHTSAAVAATALAVFQAAVTLGRLGGDRLIGRLGPVTVFRLGALIAGGGLAAGLLVGTAWSALVGLGLLGLGLANLLPISIGAAGADQNLPVAVAVARVSAMGYLGSFTGPAAIGVLAHLGSLPTALLLPAIGVAITAAAAPVVRTSPSAPRRG